MLKKPGVGLLVGEAKEWLQPPASLWTRAAPFPLFSTSTFYMRFDIESYKVVVGASFLQNRCLKFTDVNSFKGWVFTFLKLTGKGHFMYLSYNKVISAVLFKNNFVEHLLCIRQYTMPFICLDSFNAHANPVWPAVMHIL